MSESTRSNKVQWGRETITVTAPLGAPPAEPASHERDHACKTSIDNPRISVPLEASAALARAFVRPDLMTQQMSSRMDGLLIEEHVDGATVSSVHGRVFLTEILPGIQPRTGQEAMDTADPVVVGFAEQARPQAMIKYLFENHQHLRQHTWQTIASTLHMNSYAESIVSRGITRPLIAHTVRIEFRDGSPPLHAVVARDGITRLASSWQVLAGPGATPEKAAELAVNTLISTDTPDGEASGIDWFAAKRFRFRTELREEYATEVKKGTAATRAAQIAQTFTAPAYIAVGIESGLHGGMSAENVFDEAIRSILASVHIEFKPWDDSAQNLEVVTRALKQFAQTTEQLYGDQPRLWKIYNLAVRRSHEDSLAQVFEDDAIPNTALWRAVYLVHTLASPGYHDELKARAKEIKNERRMSSKGYAGLLGPVIDAPWRAAKAAVMKQARNAWSNGGVLCEEVLAGEWRPSPTTDFLSLVEPALAGDVNARLTLAVAGGVALIADKLITRNVGSAVSAERRAGKVPFRSDVSNVIGGLARKDNELGLWILAHAADRFREDAVPVNGIGQRGAPTAGAEGSPYRHVAVDLQAADRILRQDGGEVELTSWDVVLASDPARAARFAPPLPPATEQPAALSVATPFFSDAAEPKPESATPDAQEHTSVPHDPVHSAVIAQTAVVFQSAAAAQQDLSTGQRIAEERRHLLDVLSTAQQSAAKLEELGKRVSFPPLLGSPEEWITLQESAFDVLEFIQRNRPGGVEEPDEDEE